MLVFIQPKHLPDALKGTLECVFALASDPSHHYFKIENTPSMRIMKMAILFYTTSAQSNENQPLKPVVIRKL